MNSTIKSRGHLKQDTHNPEMHQNSSFETSEMSGVGQKQPILCHCGLEVPLHTSWTPLNPGRRFCSYPGKRGQRCGFFEWHDPEICRRSTQIIPGLLNRINTQEATIGRLRRRERVLWFGLFVCLIVTLVVVYGKSTCAC